MMGAAARRRRRAAARVAWWERPGREDGGGGGGPFLEALSERKPPALGIGWWRRPGFHTSWLAVRGFTVRGRVGGRIKIEPAVVAIAFFFFTLSDLPFQKVVRPCSSAKIFCIRILLI